MHSNTGWTLNISYDILNIGDLSPLACLLRLCVFSPPYPLSFNACIVQLQVYLPLRVLVYWSHASPQPLSLTQVNRLAGIAVMLHCLLPPSWVPPLDTPSMAPLATQAPGE